MIPWSGAQFTQVPSHSDIAAYHKFIEHYTSAQVFTGCTASAMSRLPFEERSSAASRTCQKSDLTVIFSGDNITWFVCFKDMCTLKTQVSLPVIAFSSQLKFRVGKHGLNTMHSSYEERFF